VRLELGHSRAKGVINKNLDYAEAAILCTASGKVAQNRIKVISSGWCRFFSLLPQEHLLGGTSWTLHPSNGLLTPSPGFSITWV